MACYLQPETLVSTQWVWEHRNDPAVRIVEVDVDTTAYEQGHLPGAIGWNWTTQLCNTRVPDIIPREQLQQLLGQSGIGPSTTIVLYGDNNNWFACWAFWQLKLYGHADVRLMNGGRKKWLEESRELTTEVPALASASYPAREPDWSLRAFLPEMQQLVNNRGVGASMVDVRGPQEFTGEILAPPGLPETCQSGGHIPGAANIPWGQACNEDGAFKSYDDLKALYEGRGITPGQTVYTYCRIGERSSHSWYVLKYLLGYPDVRNYDGSWTEWGNLVNAPVER